MDVSRALEALQRVLPESQFAFRGTSEYDTLNHTYQSGFNADISPAAIFQPKTKDEVSVFVRTIKQFAVNGQCPFAIVGGGCQPAPGCSNIQDGITLSLGLLKGIEIKDGLVSIAAGERWGPVYDKLGAHGLGVAGSRSAKSGIGGLALQGFICDNVVNYEVVLASGDIVNANATENSDLWLALRGAGNNLGIVTRFDFTTFQQGPLYGGSVFYFGHNFPGQIEALVNELRKPDATNETHLMVSIGYGAAFGPQAMCLNQVYCTKGIDKSPVLDPFTSIQPQLDNLNSMRMHTLAEAVKEQAGDSPNILRSCYMNTTIKADVAALQAATDIYTEALQPVKTCEGFVGSLTLQPYAHSLLKKSATKGGNMLGLSPDLGPVVSVLLLTYWTNKDDDEKILAILKDTLEKIERDAVSRGQKVDHTYMNYSFTFQDPIGSYGEENKRKLQAVSTKYDPQGLFQKGVPGGWKLFP